MTELLWVADLFAALYKGFCSVIIYLIVIDLSATHVKLGFLKAYT
jgi:hypothetical protein